VSFDPERERDGLRATLELDARADRAQYLPNAVGNAAVLGLGTAVRGWIVGLEAEAMPLVATYREWLDDSIGRGETFGEPPSYFALLRHQALAVARWLVENESPTDVYRETLALHERAWVDVEMHERHLAEFVRDCYEAGECERAGVVAAARGEDVRTELDLAAWACRRPPAAAIVSAGERVLRGRAEEWLDLGQTLRLAAWLKLVFWDTGAATAPGATLLRTYDLVRG
jgi:hypothetical protein